MNRGATRLFFALWPSEAERQALLAACGAALVEACGRPVPPANLHVTLAFLGAVPAVRRAGVASAASLAVSGAVPASGSPTVSVEITFERVERWARAQVLCAVPGVPPTGVERLACALREALAQEGFTLEARPFRPHVTLARKVMRSFTTRALPEVRWRAEELVLVESDTRPEGSSYSIVGRWRLDGCDTRESC
jgi:RNA 2',3'-cyclic 3'-phosphodiesterase